MTKSTSTTSSSSRIISAAPSAHSDGDFNYDGVVNFNDFLILQNTFGTTLGGTTAAMTAEQIASLTAFAASVPEPGMLGLVVAGATWAVRRRGSRSRALSDRAG